jgi:hypothetical protein
MRFRVIQNVHLVVLRASESKEEDMKHDLKQEFWEERRTKTKKRQRRLYNNNNAT